MQKSKLPRTLKPFAHIIQAFRNEGEDGYWAYLMPGIYCPESGTTAIHEATLMRCARQLAPIAKRVREARTYQ